MTVRWLLAALHLLALGIGLGAIWARAMALRGTLDTAGIRRVLQADTLWGVAAFLWISTGLVRAFAGFEKGSAYYLNNHVFWSKMALLVIILLLEAKPMVTFIQWRIRLGSDGAVDMTNARMLSKISIIQAILTVAMVFAATAMARGMGR